MPQKFFFSICSSVCALRACRKTIAFFFSLIIFASFNATPCIVLRRTVIHDSRQAYFPSCLYAAKYLLFFCYKLSPGSCHTLYCLILHCYSRFSASIVSQLPVCLVSVRSDSLFSPFPVASSLLILLFLNSLLASSVPFKVRY